MLIRFVVSNFLSFNEEKEFNMIAGNFKTHKHHVYAAGKLNILKASAIYGANGAGKSNLIKAFHYFQEIVRNGTSIIVDEKKFRLNKTNKNKPICFEIEFSVDKKFYSYGLKINESNITEEWLYESGITKDDKLIFERTNSDSGKVVLNIADKFKRNPKQKLLFEVTGENFLKKDKTLLGLAENLKIDEILKARNWILHNMTVIFPESKFGGLFDAIKKSTSFNSLANEILDYCGTGVSELDIETIEFEKFFYNEDDDLKNSLLLGLKTNKSFPFLSEKGFVLITKEDKKNVVKKVISKHKDNVGLSIAFNLTEESDGTQRLLDLIPAFNLIMEDEVTFIVDEIDRSLHPALLKSLISIIMAKTNTRGQLIFTTHESNLLDMNIFRQDEIWFAEKDIDTGETQLYSLSEFKPRYDLDIQKGYLNGRFGAVPFLAKLEDLNWA
jgi:AAA15 family ATPase/GTPase